MFYDHEPHKIVLPRMYGAVKSVLKASPMANRKIRNGVWLVTNGIKIPTIPAIRLETIIVGKRPNESENQPKKSIPGIAPMKNRSWERAGIHALPHTQLSCTVMEVW